jgi:hypothetical protein
MNKKTKENTLKIIGFIFLGIYIYIFIGFVISKDLLGLFWMCYIGIFLITLGIFLKKPNLVLSQIFILLIPDLLWTLDFFYRLLTNNSLFGFENFFFDTTQLSRKLLALQHTIVPFLSLFYIYLTRPKKLEKPLFISIIEIFFLLILSFIIPPSKGINCLPYVSSCFSFPNPFPLPYPLIWFIIMILFSLISYFSIKKWVSYLRK